MAEITPEQVIEKINQTITEKTSGLISREEMESVNQISKHYANSRRNQRKRGYRFD